MLLWEKDSRNSGTRMGFFMVHLLSGRTADRAARGETGFSSKEEG
ncbi:MAG TPA: hypothetical protein DEB17_02195 [Chlorobaculum sp.]|uniref:Uncharacterized protein n=1 Tax=Chlorobaculum tepidum (strain ATCC 49652 / DSM 12025 / NBRC 103806 / TLS) TaxID=194439 RepID=Q8KEM1_CHLTE|nr:hypothetical protein CT0667 [Chlorobaculum tepidum TLS]HBU22809.1 hypothetical protein [Chlorobaculum sp.]